MDDSVDSSFDRMRGVVEQETEKEQEEEAGIEIKSECSGVTRERKTKAEVWARKPPKRRRMGGGEKGREETRRDEDREERQGVVSVGTVNSTMVDGDADRAEDRDKQSASRGNEAVTVAGGEGGGAAQATESGLQLDTETATGSRTGDDRMIVDGDAEEKEKQKEEERKAEKARRVAAKRAVLLKMKRDRARLWRGETVVDKQQEERGVEQNEGDGGERELASGDAARTQRHLSLLASHLIHSLGCEAVHTDVHMEADIVGVRSLLTVCSLVSATEKTLFTVADHCPLVRKKSVREQESSMIGAMRGRLLEAVLFGGAGAVGGGGGGGGTGCASLRSLLAHGDCHSAEDEKGECCKDLIKCLAIPVWHLLKRLTEEEESLFPTVSRSFWSSRPLLVPRNMLPRLSPLVSSREVCLIGVDDVEKEQQMHREQFPCDPLRTVYRVLDWCGEGERAKLEKDAVTGAWKTDAMTTCAAYKWRQLRLPGGSATPSVSACSLQTPPSPTPPTTPSSSRHSSQPLTPVLSVVSIIDLEYRAREEREREEQRWERERRRRDDRRRREEENETRRRRREEDAERRRQTEQEQRRARVGAAAEGRRRRQEQSSRPETFCTSSVASPGSVNFWQAEKERSSRSVSRDVDQSMGGAVPRSHAPSPDDQLMRIEMRMRGVHSPVPAPLEFESARDPNQRCGSNAAHGANWGVPGRGRGGVIVADDDAVTRRAYGGGVSVGGVYDRSSWVESYGGWAWIGAPHAERVEEIMGHVPYDGLGGSRERAHAWGGVWEQPTEQSLPAVEQPVVETEQRVREIRSSPPRYDSDDDDAEDI